MSKDSISSRSHSFGSSESDQEPMANNIQNVKDSKKVQSTTFPTNETAKYSGDPNGMIDSMS